MLEESRHTATVESWMKRVPEDLAPSQLVSALERGFNALWDRARPTLGSVTLSAIVHRVLQETSKDFPLLAVLKIEHGSAVQFDDLRARATAEDERHLREGLREFLLRFLTILGNLTGQILTPGLHAALDQVTVDDLATARNAEAARPDGSGLQKEGER